MSRKWGRHSKGRTDGESSVLTERKDEWWVHDEPTRVINRRWRRNRPDGPLRRRATDLHSDVPTSRPSGAFDPPEDTASEHFDADALFRDMYAQPDPELVDGTEPWAVLGLTSEATWAEVVARQRELAKVHHPDRQGESEPSDQMAEINAAVAELRRIYRISDDI